MPGPFKINSTLIEKTAYLQHHKLAICSFSALALGVLLGSGVLTPAAVRSSTQLVRLDQHPLNFIHLASAGNESSRANSVWAGGLETPIGSSSSDSRSENGEEQPATSASYTS
jgi:hypothetical protein